VPAFKVQGLDHVALSVSDLKRSSAFYAEVLGLERAYDEWHEPVFMVAEGTGLALFSTELHESSGDPYAKPPSASCTSPSGSLARASMRRGRSSPTAGSKPASRTTAPPTRSTSMIPMATRSS
jgi:catechol 2,3-dioxygenase-like lactoylglutathione lyase family enzyme